MTDIVPGAAAPDFTLQDQYGRDTALSALRGRPVLAVFYPLAFSGVCSGELAELSARHAELAELGTVLAISVDSVFALRTWSDREAFPFALLSDFWPHGAVADAYGVLDHGRGTARRATFLIDAAGVVRWSTLVPVSEPRDTDAYLEQMRALA
ncbi:redoxin domain-containing protein [Nocardiopsis changdeensis]|uniref:Redoxin domain-containing protein n=1 Tax=Nocardiopsis changdeensis TaxID=2831969 RepID=A0ABX8BSB6_9ACTN|nr:MULTISPECIES: redoxin domain-containing protein [Nocardiopsis]QUX24663.1 redoxin domain-containing protein [Nocardiopsis changdeensis]QYX35051.1 redoxin domain-containing protein [Nocardiopsis sp. MT53]